MEGGCANAVPHYQNCEPEFPTQTIRKETGRGSAEVVYALRYQKDNTPKSVLLQLLLLDHVQ